MEDGGFVFWAIAVALLLGVSEWFARKDGGGDPEGEEEEVDEVEGAAARAGIQGAAARAGIQGAAARAGIRVPLYTCGVCGREYMVPALAQLCHNGARLEGDEDGEVLV